MATTHLLLSTLVAGQASPEVTINQALNMLDAFVQTSVVSRTLTTPPGSPTKGSKYIVGASATDAWSGHDDEIAVYIDGWLFITPIVGWKVYVVAEMLSLMWNGSAWKGARSVDYAVVASTTHTQGGATLLTAEINHIATIVANDDSLRLPPAYDGARCLIFNPSGYSVLVFPSSGDKINTLSVNASTTLGIARGTTFHGTNGHWLQM